LRAKNQKADEASAEENQPRSYWKTFVSAARSYGATYYARKKQKEENEAAIVRWTIVIGLGTCAAALIAAGAAGLLIAQLYDARESTVLANRAWVTVINPAKRIGSAGPNRMTIDTVFNLTNIGNGPALHAAIYLESFWWYPALRREGTNATIDMDNQTFPDNTACEKIATVTDRGTLWQKQAGVFVATKKRSEPPPEFYQFRAVYGVHGCIRYSSFGKTRWTRICEFLTPVPQQPISSWQYAFCPGSGQNTAD
jgi:hypothetical protein